MDNIDFELLGQLLGFFERIISMFRQSNGQKTENTKKKRKKRKKKKKRKKG